MVKEKENINKLKSSETFSFREIINGDIFAREQLMKNLWYILFVVFLTVIYIYNKYQTENVLQYSKAEILSYVDDDIEAYPGWLEAIQNVFQSDESVALVGGNNIPNYENTPPKWLKILWNKPFLNGNAVSA